MYEGVSSYPGLWKNEFTRLTLLSALGFLVTLYATLITLFGLAWVLFLIGMDPLGYLSISKI